MMPGTALPRAGLRTSVILRIVVGVFCFVVIIDPHETAGESHDLAERDEHRFFDLPLWLDIESAEEENHPADSENGGGEQLYVG